MMEARMANDFQLRRVGSPASCPGVRDVLRLKNTKTVLGRNASSVDFFLDSAVHKRLISREHAEIIVDKSDGEQSVGVTIRDKSLNGTFVNDIKIKGTAKLNVGDVLTFGHLQGIKVQAGVFSEQPDSEFRFVLEYADAENEAYEEQENGDTIKPKIAVVKAITKGGLSIPEKGTTPVLRDINGVPPPPPMMHEPIRPIFSPEKSDHVTPATQSAASEGKVEMIQGEDGKVTYIYSVQVGPRSSPKTPGCDQRTDVNSNLTGTTTAKQTPVESHDVKQPDSHKNKREETSVQTTPAKGKSTPHRTVLEWVSPGSGGSSSKTSLSEQQKNSMAAENDPLSVFYFDSDTESDGEVTSSIQARVNEICQMGETQESSQPGSPSFKLDIRDPQPPEKSSPPLASPAGLSAGEPSTRQLRKHKVHVSSQIKTRKKPRLSYQKKRTSGSAKKVTDAKDDFAVCNSADCCQPMDQTVTWVQCDDCDAWYHVTCVGCDYDKVKQPNTLFHCGCV